MKHTGFLGSLGMPSSSRTWSEMTCKASSVSVNSSLRGLRDEFLTPSTSSKVHSRVLETAVAPVTTFCRVRSDQVEVESKGGRGTYMYWPKPESRGRVGAGESRLRLERLSND